MLPMLSAKDDRSTPRVTSPAPVLRLEKRPLIKDLPAMKVIYSKQIISRDDPDVSPSAKPVPFGRTQSQGVERGLDKRNSSPVKATTSNIERQPADNARPLDAEKSFSQEGSKTEGTASEKFIEVTTANFRSALKSQPQPKTDTQASDSKRSGQQHEKAFIDERAKSDWLKQYGQYLKRQLEDWQVQFSLRGQKDLAQPVRPAFLIVAPDEGVTATHAKESARSPAHHSRPFARPAAIQPEAAPSKFSLNDLRKRNQTAPDLNLIADGGKPPRVPPQISGSAFKISPPRPTVLPPPSLPEEVDSPRLAGKSAHGSNQSKGGVGSSDSLSLPQFTLRKHLTPSVKSFHHSMKARLNELQHASNGIIVEQDSEDNDESIDHPRAFEASRAQSLVKRFADFKNRNKTTVPPLHRGDQASIFGTAKEKPHGQPPVKENSKIRESENESNTSELLGDRLFKDLDLSLSSGPAS